MFRRTGGCTFEAERLSPPLLLAGPKKADTLIRPSGRWADVGVCCRMIERPAHASCYFRKETAAVEATSLGPFLEASASNDSVSAASRFSAHTLMHQ